MPWDVPEFRTGVAVGSVAAVALLACSLVVPRRPARTLALGGTALAVSALVAYERVGTVPGRLVVGVVGTGLVVAIGAAFRAPAWLAAIGIAPFAYVVAQHPNFGRPHWFSSLLAVAIVIGAAGAMSFETAEGAECVTPALLAISAAGVYWAVPDTELPACLLGVALPVALVAWPLRRSSAGRAGAAASVVTLCWAAAVGGLGRPASLVGAVACLGLLVGVPVGRTLSPFVRPPREAVDRRGPWRPPALLASHAALVAIASRAAGTRESVRAAVVIAVVVACVSVVIGTGFPRTAPACPRPTPRR